MNFENFLNEVRREGGLLGKLTAKASDGIKNLFSTTLRVEKVVADSEGNFIENCLEGIYAVADAIVRNNIIKGSGKS